MRSKAFILKSRNPRKDRYDYWMSALTAKGMLKY